MAITAVLFDLDGTLLPMDMEKFVSAYISGMCAKAAPYGYEPKKLADSIFAGTMAMAKNTGEKTNEEVFWELFCARYGAEARKDEGIFEAYYRNEFQAVRHSCGFQPLTRPLIKMLRAAGLRLVLATNPLFPRLATESRIRWAGISPEDFELCTTYENSRHCKPNTEYYKDILEQLELRPDECIMVGNDVEEDMAARELGLEVYLITDCLINRRGKDISVYPHGDFAAFVDYIGKRISAESEQM